MHTPKDVVSLFLPSLRGGGAERVMVTLANGFAERGFKVDIVLAAAEGPYFSEVSDAVRIVDLKASRVATSIPKLARYLRKQRPRALLSTLRHANIAAAMAHKLSGSQSILVLREANHVRNEDFKSLAGGFNAILYRWAHRNAHGVVGVSDGVSASVANVVGPGCNVVTIYNPVDVDSVITLSHGEMLPNVISAGDKVVLSVGRLTEQKDYPTLMKAFAEVRRHMPAKLIILGEGQERQKLSDLAESLSISEDVFMLGFVANPYAFMRRADVFVLSSLWEGLPNTLIQAMACDTPVVSTDCPSGPAEILEGGKWGELVPVGDHVALADAMAKNLASSKRTVADRAMDFAAAIAIERYLNLLIVR